MFLAEKNYYIFSNNAIKKVFYKNKALNNTIFFYCMQSLFLIWYKF